MTQMQSLTGDSEPQWREVGYERKCKWSLNRIKPACHLQNVNIWARFYPRKEFVSWVKIGGLSLKANLPSKYLSCLLHILYQRYSILTSMYKSKEIVLGSVWLRFSFKSYWHHAQWPCNLWELLGPLTEVVKHPDWLGRYEMCAVMAYCRLYARATCRELHGFLLSQINYSTQSN